MNKEDLSKMYADINSRLSDKKLDEDIIKRMCSRFNNKDLLNEKIILTSDPFKSYRAIGTKIFDCILDDANFKIKNT